MDRCGEGAAPGLLGGWNRTHLPAQRTLGPPRGRGVSRPGRLCSCGVVSSLDPYAAHPAATWGPWRRGGARGAGRGASPCPGLPILPAAPPRLCAPPVAPGAVDPRSPLTDPGRARGLPPLCAHSSRSRDDFSPFVHPQICMGHQLRGRASFGRSKSGANTNAHNRRTAGCNQCYEETRNVEVEAKTFKGEAGRWAIRRWGPAGRVLLGTKAGSGLA